MQRDFVAGEWETAEGGDERGDEGEDGDLDEDGGAGGSAEEEELAEVEIFDAARSLLAEAGEKAVVVVAVGAPYGKDEDAHEIEAGEAGGPRRAGDSEGGDAVAVTGEDPVMAEDQEPVAGCVDEVGGDESEGDGAAVVVRLQVAAEGEVEHQWERAVVEALHGGDGLGEDGVVDGEVQEEDRGEGKDGDEQSRESDGHDEAVEEPAIGLFVLFGAEGLGDEGVETEEDAADAEAEGVEEDLREGGGAHGEGGVGEMAEHDGVDQRHGDPAELAAMSGRARWTSGGSSLRRSLNLRRIR